VAQDASRLRFLNPDGGAIVWTGMSEQGLVIDELETAAGDGVNRDAAFATLADHHLDRAYRLAAVLLGNELEAQDAVQDAATSAWARFGDLRDRGRFDAWFDRILVNGCRDRLRARRRVRLVELDAALHPAVPDDTGQTGERDALQRALAQLPADQRLAVALRYFGDRSLEEIAELTGERLGTVKSRLHYGLQALRAAYDAAGRLPGEASR
jgi:RNA polymerase sigma-70 factor (ECF subfamily)